MVMHPFVEPTSFLRRALQALCLGCVAMATAHAQLPQAADLAALEQQGYVPLDRIATPLLAVANQLQQPDVARVVLYSGRMELPAAQQRDAQALQSNDQFVRHDALQRLMPLLEARARQVASATGFLVPVRAALGPYDFQRHRFALSLQLRLQPAHALRGYFCAGAYAQDRYARLSACVQPTNWDRGSLAFEYVVADDERAAEAFHSEFQRHQFGFFLVVTRDGALRGAPRPPLTYGYFPRTRVAEVQPVRVLGLVVLDPQGRVLSRTAMPD